MIRALYTAATGMEAQQLKIDNISNNIANSQTIGYKKSTACFEDMIYQNVKLAGMSSSASSKSEATLQVGHGTRPTSLQKVFTQGSFKQTQGDLDLAIEGAGFFQVRKPNGELAYTRAGNFRQDKDGNIVTNHGYMIDPPISIPSDAIKVNVGEDGVVSVLQAGQQKETEVGKIDLVNFANPAALEAIGKNLYVANEAAGEPIVGVPGEEGMGTVLQGFLESANVNIAEELIELILAQRGYEMSSKVIQVTDQMLQNANNMR